MENLLLLIPDFICSFGMSLIDENLNALLAAMEDASPNFALGTIMTYAKTVGLCIALGVGANECYQMILGRRGMDVMKLLHIIIISICISSAGSIASMAGMPGKLLENAARGGLNGINDEIVAQENEIAQLQEQYVEAIREKFKKLEEAQHLENMQQVDGTIDEIKAWIAEKFYHLGNILKEMALMTETKLCEWISILLKFLAQVFFQAVTYGLLVCQRIFLHLLAAFAPLMFAMSLSPHYKAAWSQWLSKYISVSLWGFVTYTVLYYSFFIISYNLQLDKAAYETLLAGVSTSEDAGVGAIGMQALGSTCMYIVGLLVGIKALSFVPEICSWLIPGGVASGAASSASSVATAGAGMAASGANAARHGVGSAATAALKYNGSIK